MSGKKPKLSPAPNLTLNAAEEILRVCSAPANTQGVAQDDLELALNVPKEVMLEALNLLIKRGKLVPCPGVNGKILFRIQSDEVAAKFFGLSAEDRLVYQEVERAGSSGISTRDLCMHTNFQHPQLTKVRRPCIHVEPLSRTSATAKHVDDTDDHCSASSLHRHRRATPHRC